MGIAAGGGLPAGRDCRVLRSKFNSDIVSDGLTGFEIVEFI